MQHIAAICDGAPRNPQERQDRPPSFNYLDFSQEADMSMHDPYGRPRPRTDDMTRGSGWIFGGVLALLLILGIIMWGGSGGDRETAGVVDPPAATGPSTTGSGSASAPPAQPSTTGRAAD
jgi:hypothetical protein